MPTKAKQETGKTFLEHVPTKIPECFICSSRKTYGLIVTKDDKVELQYYHRFFNGKSRFLCIKHFKICRMADKILGYILYYILRIFK